MKKTLIAEWTHALRSGEYRQGTGELMGRDSTGNTYCCLGVLCKVIGMERRVIYQKDTLDNVGRPELLGPWDASNTDPHFDSGREETLTTVQRRLAAMNDNDCTFGEIADWIESNVPIE